LELRHTQQVERAPLTKETVVDSDHHKKVGCRPNDKYSGAHPKNGKGPGNANNLNRARAKREESIWTATHALARTRVHMKKDIQWRRRRENYQRRDGVGTLLPLGGELAPSFRGHWGERNSGLDDGAGTRCRLGA
jgi:hypothetical protein